jgi:hypothetical protein
LWISWLNNDHVLSAFLARFHHLLRAGLQRSFALRFVSHPLHRIHHIRLLGDKGVPQVRRPLNIAGHPLKSVRNCRERLDARIPRLLCHGIRERFVLET